MSVSDFRTVLQCVCIRIWMFTTTCLVWDEYYNRIFIYVMHDNSQWILAERVGTE